MNKQKKRIIKGADLRNDESINNVFRTLMDFPDWDGKRMEEWIDMVSLTNPMNPTVPRLHAQQLERFELEIQGADLAHIKPRQIKALVRRVAIINKRYQQRTGSSIVSLVVT